jgi:hypothetical protein
MIEFVLNFSEISLSMHNIKESVRNSSSILFRSIGLTIFMAENGCSIVALETRASWMALGEKSDFFSFFFLFMISHFF